MDKNRRAAMEALLNIEEKGAYSNLAVAAAIGKYHPDSEAFVRTLVYGVLENQIYIDYRVRPLVRSGMKKVRPAARILIRMGVYQIEFMDSVPDYAAIDGSVRIAKKACRGLEGFVNGVLRSFARGKGQPLPDPAADPVRYLSVKYSCAESIVRMWISMFGEERTEALLAAGNEVPDLTICVNTLRTDEEELTERLKKDGVFAEPVRVAEPFASRLESRALRVEGGGLMAGEAFREGRFYVQDAASMAAVSALAPEPGHTVIDMCAAPGGKSFFSAIQMENKGRILACDIYEHKMELIASTARRLGISIVEPRLRDARERDEALAGAADRVIVDAPCSGLGVARRRPEIKLRDDRDYEELAALQRQILDNACAYVRPGGRLMYSTCTISDAENGQVTAAFLAAHPEFRLLTETQLMPDTDRCDGFYFAVMERQ